MSRDSFATRASRDPDVGQRGGSALHELPWQDRLRAGLVKIAHAPTPVQVFIIYAREDSDALEQLCDILSPLEEAGDAAIWWDRLIQPTVPWDDAIKSRLNDADVVIVLMSESTGQSSYICSEEIPAAMASHEAHGTSVFPIFLNEAGRDAVIGPHPHEGLRVLERFQTWPPEKMTLTSRSGDWKQVHRSVVDAIRLRRVSELKAELFCVLPDGASAELVRAGITAVFGEAPDLELLVRDAPEVRKSAIDEARAHGIVAMGSATHLSPSGEGPPWAVDGLVRHAVGSEDEDVVMLAAAILTDSDYLAHWLAETADVDILWTTLQRLHSLVRDSTMRTRLLELHRFIAYSLSAFEPRRLDARSLLNSWRASRGTLRDERRRRASHIRIDPIPESRSPINMGFGVVEWLRGSEALLLGCTEGIHRYDARTLEWQSMLHVPGEGTRRIRASPDGRRYLLSSGRVSVRDGHTDAPIAFLEMQDGRVYPEHAGAWSRDGTRIYGTNIYILTCWDATTGRIVEQVTLPDINRRPIEWVGDQLLALTNEIDSDHNKHCLLVIDSDTLCVERAIELPKGSISSDSSIVEVPSRGGALLLLDRQLAWWDAEREQVDLVREHDYEPWAQVQSSFNSPVRLSQDETEIWLLCRDHRFVVLDAETLDARRVIPIRELPPSEDWEGWTFLPDGRVALKSELSAFVVDIADETTQCFARGWSFSRSVTWVPDPSGRVAWSKDRGFGVLDLGTLEVRAGRHPDNVTHADAHSRSDGSVLFVTIDDERCLRLWNTKNAKVLDRSTAVRDAGSGTTYAISYDGVHIYTLVCGGDDQITHFVSVACDGKQLGTSWSTSVFGENDLRMITSMCACGGTLVMASAKSNRLIALPKALHLMRTEALRPSAYSILDAQRSADGWCKFLRAPEGDRVYAYNRKTWTVAVVDLGGTPKLTTLCSGVSCTTWHVAGRYLCVASNFQNCVFLIDRHSGDVRPITVEPSVALCAAWGPDARDIEVWRLGELVPIRFSRAAESTS